ncbi:MAG: B12-binding domain-containing radical SAM protein [Chitinophagaceae bacterium]
MKVVFVDNLLLKRENDINHFVLQPHLGLISLISVIERGGHQGILYDPKLDIHQEKFGIDPHLYYNIAQKILEFSPDVIGFTSLGCNFICTAKIAQYIRNEVPHIPILLGGPHATVLDSIILRKFSQFDIIVRNEAEMKILPVLEALGSRNFENISGVTYKNYLDEIIHNPGDDIIENLDDLPFPAYHAYPIKELGLKSLRVEAGRGCPFKCTFCSTATFFGRRYRLKSPGVLCRELDYLYNTYGISDFGLTHDLFTVNRNKVIDFCDTVKARGYTWKCSARMDCVDADLLKEMKNSGCNSIYYGIEAGSERMQKISKKNLDLDIYEKTLNNTLSLKIEPTLSFITGYPQETPDDQNQTLNLIGTSFNKRTETGINVQLHLLTPEPGTALLNEFQKSMEFDSHISDFNFPTLESDDEFIMHSMPDIFMNHHYFKTIISRQKNIFVTTFFQVLLPLGREVINHLLGSYENKMNNLFDEFYIWYVKNCPDKSVNFENVIKYVEERFTPGDYMVSLVKYMYQIFRLNYLSREFPASVSPSGKYSLNPKARLMNDIHNCPVILEYLKKNKKIPAGLKEEHVNIVLQLISNDKDGYVVNFNISDALAEIVRSIADGEILAEIDPMLYKNLMKSGVIIPNLYHRSKSIMY